MDERKTECPVCSKEFTTSIIEAHVEKCLFLNESSQSESTGGLKRSSPSVKSQQIRSGNSRSASKRAKHRIVKTLNADKPNVSSATSVSITENSGQASNNISKENNVNPEKKIPVKHNHVPLAERMRPTSLLGYIGQEHVLGPNAVLSQLLEKTEIPNIILWGPPGCGKTSLASVIAHICKQAPASNLRYVKLSAAMSGVNDVKEAVNVASNELKFGRRTIMFMDEIHRFNKLQQDIFLPHVESGTLTLIGATTENPSFSLNSALLSRCRVIVLEKLTAMNLIIILRRAVQSLGGNIYKYVPSDSSGETRMPKPKVVDGESEVPEIPKFHIDEETIQWLAETCDGDARIALGGLELAVQSKAPSEDKFLEEGPGLITLDDIRDSLKKTHMLYDKKGEQHYDMISALHKSVRASDENASLYWLTRMMSGGEDPVYIARRLIRMACEDIGLEDTKALGVAIDTMHGCKMLGMPECDVLLAQCVTYMARAPKSRLMEDALRTAQKVVANHKGPQPAVPLHLRNAPTKLMSQLGYSKGYNMLHKDESGLNYLPEGLEDLDFFQEETSF
ncbi:ATPase WRNIP1 [Cephus cinctus]|uniref:ATPase WRNIP1 n=1 Tax=Cephus cinctus TaxID=211228 RepID=A0AAJ7CGX8_CEPCN|nr:ATPase WRNIP1 [Cephus cinctus]XP_015609971.1 ATPase WRNIP1 [Cephus cinctus]XP_015609972.1 ATPase WRNIP1 [Cephus cinctus]